MIDLKQLQFLLQTLGFSDKEAQVYLLLLELNEALPSVIARKTGLKRPTVYMVLEELQKRGLVSSIKRSNVLYYQSSKPEFFLEKERADLLQKNRSLEALSTSLPELLALHHQYAATPQMSVYYGKEGLIQVMEDTLTSKTELLCWANPEVVYSVLESYYPIYIKKKVQRKIWLRGIFCQDKIGERFKTRSKKELREVILIPKEKYPFKNEINIYDDKVAIISHADKVGIIIQNQDIADSQRAIFNLAFDYAKILNKEGASGNGRKR